TVMRHDRQRGRRYDGRPLVRPDEEVVDQGLGFDLGTLMGRRQVLRAFGVGLSALGFGAGGGERAAPTGTPRALGRPLTAPPSGGKPFAGTAVYVWHCDREGRYSLYSEGVTGENYLRGVQVADASGKVRFTSVFPACYDG